MPVKKVIKKDNLTDFDRNIGLLIKKRRMILNLSQTELAKKLDVSFQQLQKYEKGTNKISCSRLYELSIALSTNINYFFEGVEKKHLLGDDIEITRKILELEQQIYKEKKNSCQKIKDSRAERDRVTYYIKNELEIIANTIKTDTKKIRKLEKYRKNRFIEILRKNYKDIINIIENLESKNKGFLTD